MGSNAGKLNHASHLMAWLGGGLTAMTPFVCGWTLVFGGIATPVRVWPGNLIVEAMVGAILAICGTILGGFWWCAGGGRDLRRSHLLAWLLATWGVAGCLGFLVPWIYWTGSGLLVLGLGFGWLAAWRRRRGVACSSDEVVKMRWNGVFFGLILVLSVTSDCLVLSKMDASPAAALALVLVRLLTQGVIVTLLWYGLHLFELWSPPATRWLGAGVLCLILVGLAAEIGMNLLWGKGLILFFGELVVGGKFDLLRAMEGGNVKFSLGNALQLAALAVLVLGLYLGSGWLSQRIGLRLRPRSLLLAAATVWLLLFLEQRAEVHWLDRGGHWLQRRSLLVHLCPSNSAPGWVSFSVKFREQPRPAAWNMPCKPDVHLFIVETFRADALCPEKMPFLSHWRDTECQPLQATFSASNATHMSWFALLSGKPAVFWERERQVQRPALLLDMLHAAGYRNELRSASIFDYAEMDTTNFGHGEATDDMLNKRVNPNSWLPDASECDRIVREHWQQSVLTRPAGATFRLMAVESPHFPYYWAKSFTPPLADYYRSAMLPLHPSERDVQLVKNRYVNSVAWTDGLLRDYITYLKEHDRYDDAMIVITGDHGEEFQEHGFWFHATGLTREQTSVPLLIKWPKNVGPGAPVAQASHLDIVPSILEALGCPPEQLLGFAGRSLHHGGDATVLVTTHFASHNCEGMHWRRNGYEAAFSWAKIWVPGMPDRLWLERLTGPDGDLRFATPEAAEAALHRYFPDAFERWFTRFQQDHTAP